MLKAPSTKPIRYMYNVVLSCFLHYFNIHHRNAGRNIQQRRKYNSSFRCRSFRKLTNFKLGFSFYTHYIQFKPCTYYYLYNLTIYMRHVHCSHSFNSACFLSFNIFCFVPLVFLLSIQFLG